MSGISDICSQDKKVIEPRKGFTVTFYQGNRELTFRCCSVACVDQLVKKQKSK